MSIVVPITQDGTRLETAGKYVEEDIVVGISDSIKKAAATYTPTTTDQTIAAGQFLSGAQTVKGDANLVADNIKQGVSIFGVAGSLPPGIIPTIGENGNWYIDGEDTGKPSRGEQGKSAYASAQDGGYTGTEAQFNTDLAGVSGKLSTSGNGSNVTAAFTQASTRANIATGEKLSVMFGKIAKWFSDLKTVAFSGSYNDLTNKPTIPTVPVNISAFNNDAGYLTQHQSLSAYRTAAAQDTIDSGKASSSSPTLSGTITMDGSIILSSSSYGDTLPTSSLAVGRLFFLKV